MSTISPRQSILVVDDSDDDFDATLRAFKKKNNLFNTINRCEDGQEALDYLFGLGQFSGANRPAKPGIILLDLNMPGINGRQVLEKIKADEALRAIPVIVMTNSSDQRDIEECYKIGANSYVIKPLDLAGFFESIARLKDYWFEVAVLPKPE